MKFKPCDQYPTLKVNFAHFGGGKGLKNSSHWHRKILRYMDMYPNVYADISFHDIIMNDDNEYKEQLFELCHHDYYKHRILYGSDYPLHEIYYPMKDFLEQVALVIGEDALIQIADKNPRNFLSTK